MITSSLLHPAFCRFARALAAVALLGAIVSCAFAPRESPAKNTFLLEPAMPQPVATPKPQALRIGVINVSSAFRGKSLVYRRGELAYEADFYNEFFIPPASMLTEATARAISAGNVFRRVNTPGMAAEEGDYVLDGFVSELYGDIRNAHQQAAVLTITYYLSSATTRAVVWSKEYRQRVPFAGTDAAALVKAWSNALSNIFAALVRDLAAASLPAPPT
jgi:cholesterol transport system auxiliary component